MQAHDSRAGAGLEKERGGSLHGEFSRDDDGANDQGERREVVPSGSYPWAEILVAVVRVAFGGLVEEVVGRVRHKRPLADVC